jgi:transcriptional antiterminator Rof (Rho-off)
VDDAYRPIPCAQYSGLEVAVMRREALEAVCADPGGASRTLTGRATDLRTHDGAEYLLMAPDGGDAVWLRLDRLLRVTRLRDGVHLIGP